MNITEAVAYQDAFTAVLDGSANDAQAQEVIAVTRALRSYLQEAELRALALPERRDSYLELLSPEKRAAIEESDLSEPRIVYDHSLGIIGSPAEVAAAKEARQAEIDGARVLAEKVLADEEARQAQASATRIAAEQAAATAAAAAETARQIQVVETIVTRVLAVVEEKLQRQI